MVTNFEKIIALVKQSRLATEDKADLIFLFSLAKDDDLEQVARLCSAHPEWIGKLNDNYKAKHVAMTTQNSDLWNKIIEQEEKQLNDFKI